MKPDKAFKTILPYLVALLAFFAVAAVYFAPQFEGKVISMHDEMQYRGMSQDIRDHIATYGEHPQWEGNMFSGMPAYMINFDYGVGALRRLDSAMRVVGGPAGMIFLCMASFFLMLLLWGVKPWVSIVPSLAYGLSTYTFLVLGAGHLAKVLALGYAPAMIGGVVYAYRRNFWVGAALAAFFGMMEISVNHPQITYYFGLVLAALVINEAVKAVRDKTLPRFAKATAALLAAGALALGANYAAVWYGSQYAKTTTRGGSALSEELRGDEGGKGLGLRYATAWSYGVGESFNMLVPDFKGGSSSGGFSEDGAVAQSLAKYNARNMATQLPAYWGDQPGTAGPTYLGAVAVFLAAMGLFLLRGRCKWWIVAVSLLALMLSWGSNFMPLTELFFYHFPGYNKFRAVSTILVVLQWTIPLLGALMLGVLWKGGRERKDIVRAVKYSLYVLGGITLIFALFGGTLFSFSGAGDAEMQQSGFPAEVLAAMRSERASMLRGDAFRSLIFIVLTASVVLLWAYRKIKGWLPVAALSVLVVCDLAAVNLRYLPRSKFVEKRDNEIRPTAADMAIKADTTPGFRVANFAVSTFNDATTSYFHRSIGGYHGAKLGRYQDLIDRHLSRNNMGVYNMLNTKYFIVQDQQTQQLRVQLNPEANGAAWFVSRVKTVPGASEAIVALDSLDTKNVAVVEESCTQYENLRKSLESASSAYEKHLGDTIYMAEYRVNYQKYVCRAGAPAVAVFSEIYYPYGWSCTIDGEPVEYFCADYILRGAVVPAGEHTVEFRFAAPHYRALTGFTRWTGFLVTGLLCAAIIYLIIRKKDDTGE